MTTAKVLGRLWVYDTGDPTDIEVWEHELEPMDYPHRSGAEWAREHLCECYNDAVLRELFGLPTDGNYQVVFDGTISGRKVCTMDGDDYDEEFDVGEVKFEPIPEDFMKLRTHDPVHQQPDGKWWFWCEDWTSAEGPFEDEGLARAALARYVEELEVGR